MNGSLNVHTFFTHPEYIYFLREKNIEEHRTEKQYGPKTMCDKKHENKHQVKEDPLSSMVCVFHPPLPGVCFHALCQTLFLGHIRFLFCVLLHIFLELLHCFHYYLILKVF